MNAAPIDIIRSHAQACSSPLLDRVILHDQPGALFDFARAVTRDAEWPVWMDVPIRAIVGLGHLNFTHSGATWRESLHGLTGEGWTSDVFGYFTNEIRDLDFPARGARRALRLVCLAGAVTCSNGSHRLTGALAWLCSTQSDSAILLKARTTYCPARDPLLDEIVSLSRESTTLEVARMPEVLCPGMSQVPPPSFLLRSRSRRGAVQSFEVRAHQDHLIPFPATRRSWIARMFNDGKHDDPYAHLQWATLPLTLIDAWADRGWLNASLQHAERCPKITDCAAAPIIH